MNKRPVYGGRMEAYMKKIISILLSCIMILGISVNAEEHDKINSVIEKTSEYLSEKVPGYGSVGGEWMVLGLARSEIKIPEEYYKSYYSALSEFVKKNDGKLSSKKYTEYSRVVIALTAIGKNPENVEGYNLLYPLGDFNKTIAQGLNGAVFALIALDCGAYDVPINAEAEVQATRELYIEEILKNEKKDGGWSFGGETAEIDMTAMVLQALSRYKEKTNVSAAIERGVEFLSENQKESGGYESCGVENSESIAQVLNAICALGISPQDERFVKNGSIVDALISYSTENGSFMHVKNGEGNVQMSTEQGFYALVAAKRFYDGKNSLYDMSDVLEWKENEKNEENKDKIQVIYEGKTFEDIKENLYKNKIEALAARGIINGKSENRFEPNDTMTRAEFSTIITKALSIEPVNEKCFDDVNEKDWFYKYIASAKKHGIVNGISENIFNPYGMVTKEEVACMIKRASSYVKDNVEMNEFEIRDTLSLFTDYMSVHEWAKESLAFCLVNEIISDTGMELEPKHEITRAEMADIVFNLLENLNLL